MTTSDRSKTKKNERNRKMIGGLNKNYKPTDIIPVDGIPKVQSDIVKSLEGQIDAADKTAAAETAHHEAVVAEKVADEAGDATFAGLKKYFGSVYASAPATMGDFGLEPPKKPRPLTAEQKAAAAAKRKATRAAKKAAAAAAAAPAPAKTA
jgi:hypothetical protein